MDILKEIEMSEIPDFQRVSLAHVEKESAI